MHEDGDGRLVERCRAGDKRAFESPLVRYQKPVFNAALRMLRNPRRRARRRADGLPQGV